MLESFKIQSGAPWNLVCSVEAEGRDLLCRIHGGDVHIGAVALGEWHGNRAKTSCLVGVGHREDRIATHAAHKLSGAWRATAVCCCGIHFDGISGSEIESISHEAYELASEAARRVADQRIKTEASADPILHRIDVGAETIRLDIERFGASSWAETVKTHSADVAASFHAHFQSQVRLFAPLYLSNACLNNCAYCGFRHSARFKRSTLKPDEALLQARTLEARGFRVVDLVTGEVPTDRFVDYVARVTERIRAETAIDVINLNIGSLSLEQYVRLRGAGATGYHLYQECYDPGKYFEVHQSGNKRDMAARIAGLHRAAEAGFEAVGLGILLGLSRPDAELARLVRHAEVLREDYPGLKIGFSLPRITDVDAQCTYVPSARISNDDFKKAMLFLRLRFPDANLTLTTREGQAMRDELLPFGITKISAEVSTSPGGYVEGREAATEQFAVSDERPLEQVLEAISNARLTPCF